jgi:PTS system nitrogen regulatory IIA component
MNLQESFRPECIQIGSTARDKTAVLAQIASLAKKCEALREVDERTVRTALQEREKIGSTGFGNGIAIPHCSLPGLKEFVVGLLIIPEGVDFRSTDGKKTTTFFFIVGPEEQRTRHVQILSALSKILRNPQVISRFLASHEPGEVNRLVDELLSLIHLGPSGLQKSKCLFHVVVQKEEYFDDILQIFSAAVQGSIAVLEAATAGSYLHRLPLFAAYWSEAPQSFCRIILALVEKDLCNDVIRRIQTLVEDLEDRPGVLVAVQELMYTAGSLEF